MTQIINPELSFRITGLCFKVHNELGRFCSERQYSDSFEQKLLEVGMVYFREYELSNLAEVERKGNRVDFLIVNSIIVDVKAKKFITKEDYYQMLRYLQAANKELGLIVNFRSTYLKPQRVINNTYKSRS